MALSEPADMLPPDAVLDDEPFADADLVAVIDGLTPGPGDAEDTPLARALHWQITDDGAAEWAMRHLLAAEAAVAEVRQREADYVAKIRTWANREIAAGRLEQKVARWRALLDDYALRTRDETGRATVWLPSGKVSTTSAKAKVVVVDEAQVVTWAEESLEADVLADVVQVTKKPMVVPLRKAVAIVDRVVARQVTLGLACGHAPEIRIEGDGEGVDHDAPLGTLTECLECANPIDGPPVVEVVAVDVREITEPWVVHPGTGGGVPGVAVEAGHVSPSVKPGEVR